MSVLVVLLWIYFVIGVAVGCLAAGIMTLDHNKPALKKVGIIFGSLFAWPYFLYALSELCKREK